MKSARREAVHRAEGMNPVPPHKKWRAITLATLLLAPGFWMLLAGLTAQRVPGPGAPNVAATLSFGLALIPFVYIVLAFASEHPRPATGVLQAMGLTILVGIPILVITVDAVTAMVAGVGAGAMAALRNDSHDWRPRAIAVAVSALLVMVLVRTVGAVALLPAPVFAITALGIADHIAERHQIPSSQPDAVGAGKAPATFD